MLKNRTTPKGNMRNFSHVRNQKAHCKHISLATSPVIPESAKTENIKPILNVESNQNCWKSLWSISAKWIFNDNVRNLFDHTENKINQSNSFILLNRLPAWQTRGGEESPIKKQRVSKRCRGGRWWLKALRSMVKTWCSLVNESVVIDAEWKRDGL